MKYVMCGFMFTNLEEDLRKKRKIPGVASHKFQQNIIEGLLENDSLYKVVNIPTARYYPHYPVIIFRKDSFKYNGKVLGKNIGYINLPVLNYISQYISFKRSIKKIINENLNDKIVFISYGSYLPHNLSLLSLRKKYNNILLSIIIGDINGNGAAFGSRYKGIRGLIVKWIEKKQDTFARRYDTFSVLTSGIREFLDIKEKPCTIIEGIYNSKKVKTKNSGLLEDEMIRSRNIIFYAGAIEAEYDLPHLLKAFRLIKENEYILVIAGEGSYVTSLKQAIELDNRIIYLGRLSLEEVAYIQSIATVIVNPRKSNHFYVKYTFASKNIEGLASGKPYIAHKLVSIPREYDAYIQYPDEESDVSLADKIKEICSLTDAERKKIGEKARNFILKEKNSKKQCRKIILMNDSFINKSKVEY